MIWVGAVSAIESYQTSWEFVELEGSAWIW